jgi:hypothetical protein
MGHLLAIRYVTLDGVLKLPGGSMGRFTSADPRSREIAEVWASTGAISVGRTRLVHRGGEKGL